MNFVTTLKVLAIVAIVAAGAYGGYKTGIWQQGQATEKAAIAYGCAEYVITGNDIRFNWHSQTLMMPPLTNLLPKGGK